MNSLYNLFNDVLYLQTFKKPLFTKKQESEQMVLMFEAYKGLVWYALWQQSKNKVEELKAQLGKSLTVWYLTVVLGVHPLKFTRQMNLF